MVSIAILDDYQNVALKMADWSNIARNHKITVFDQPFADLDAAAAALAAFEVVSIMRERTPFPRQMFARLPNLRLLVTSGARNLSIDLAAAADHDVVVSGTDSPSASTPELTMALMLSLARHIPFEAQQMRAGKWQTTLGQDLSGRTLGIVGLGRLGAVVARMAQAFGMTVIAWSQNLTTERAAECGVTLIDKAGLFSQSDFVTIHMKLSPRSTGLIGAAELALMKPTAHIINTSRGPIIDNEALLAALRAGQIAGCALDVYDQEPLAPGHPLRAEPRALLTPHIGYVTEQTYRAFYGGTVAAIEAWLAGQPIFLLTA